MAKTFAALSDRLDSETSVASEPALAFSAAPRLSTCRAISVAERVSVPRRRQIRRHGGKARLVLGIERGARRDTQAGAHQRQARLRRHDHAQPVRQRFLDCGRNLGRNGSPRFRRQLALALGRQREDRNVCSGNVDLARHDGRRINERVLRRTLLHFLGQVPDGDRLRVVHQSLGDALDIRRRHGLDLRQLRIGRVGVAIDDHSPRQFVSTPVGGLTALQRRRDQLVARFVQFGVGHWIVANPGDLGFKGDKPLIRRLSGAENCEHRVLPRLRRHIEAGIRLRRQLLVIDQRLVETRRLPSRQDRIHHLDDGHVLVGRSRRGPGDGDRRQRNVRFVDREFLRRRPRWLHGRHPRDVALRCGDRPEIGFHPGIKLLLVEIARDHQHGIVRPVISRVEGAHVLHRRRIEILDRTDAGAPIRMNREARLRQVEIEQLAIGLAQHRLAQLFLHHVALGAEIGLVDHQRTHPVRLGP